MKRQIKVGIFVILGLVLTAAAVMLIGSTRQLWEPKMDYQTAFNDVAGLKPGAPVRTGGLDIGQVTGVGHSGDPRDPRIFVVMSVNRAEAQRIKTDTIARVVNKGLLGDRMIEVTPGAGSRPGAVM